MFDEVGRNPTGEKGELAPPRRRWRLVDVGIRNSISDPGSGTVLPAKKKSWLPGVVLDRGLNSAEQARTSGDPALGTLITIAVAATVLLVSIP